MVFHRTASESSRFFYSILFIIWCFYSACLADAAITNRTIDDSLGDLVTGQKVIYEPASIWQTFNYSLASGGTFTRAQSTGDISATITFNGTAVYVFFMVPSDAFPHDIPFATSFSLDNGPPEPFQPSPDLNAPLSNVDELVFSKTNLVATQHTLVISASPSQNVTHIIDFDHAIYEHDDGDVVSSTTTLPPVQSQLPSPSTQTQPPTGMVWADAPQQSTITKSNSGMVAGGIIVAALVVGGLVLAIFFLRRRKLRKRREGLPSIEIDPAEDVEPESNSGGVLGPFVGAASMNPFDDSHAPGTTSASSAHVVINVMGQPPSIYRNGIAHSGAAGVPMSNLSNVALPRIRPPDRVNRGIRGVPLQPLHIVNRASSTIPSATTASGDLSQQRDLEERLGAYLLLVQQKADERSQASDGETNATESTLGQEPGYGASGYLQEKVKDQGEKLDVKNVDAQLEKMSDPDVGVEELKQMIYAMKLQIEALEAQRGVDQTLGSFEEPPPLYTPAVQAPVSRRRGLTNASNVAKDSPISPTVVDRWRAAVARFSRIGMGS